MTLNPQGKTDVLSGRVPDKSGFELDVQYTRMEICPRVNERVHMHSLVPIMLNKLITCEVV